jgi:Flp pilus assembly protein TadD
VRFPLLRAPRGLRLAGGALTLLVLAAVLGCSYLSVREVSLASDLRTANPVAALSDVNRAASLNPLSPVPGRLGGTIALQAGRLTDAERWFRQSIDRQPGGWYAWFGDGLAASGLGDAARARHDFAVAASINSQQQVVKEALARVDSVHPLTPSAALSMLVLVS